MIAVIISNKIFNSIITEPFIRGRNWIFHLFSVHNQTLKYLKKLGWTLDITLLWKFQIKESFNKLQLHVFLYINNQKLKQPPQKSLIC